MNYFKERSKTKPNLKFNSRFATIAKGRTKVFFYLGLIIILFLLPLFVPGTYFLHVLILTYIFILLTSSLRLIHLAGQMSMGHAAFMGIGAYISSLLAINLGWSPWLTMPIGVLLTFIIAYLIAIPFVRVRGIYFAMVTLFFGVGILAISDVFANYTGGFSGMAGIPPLFGTDKLPYYYFFLILIIVCHLFFYRLEFSSIGKTWKTISQSYLVAESVGINERRQRALLFAIGSCFAGVAGGGYAHYFTLLSHSSFNLSASINLIIYMLVGGIGSFSGPLIGTTILVIIPELFRSLKEFVPYIFSGIMILQLFTMPNGLAGLSGQFIRWINRSSKEKIEVSKLGGG